MKNLQQKIILGFGKEFKSRLTLGSSFMNHKDIQKIYLQACKFRSWLLYFHLKTQSLYSAFLMPCCCCKELNLNLQQEKANHDLEFDDHLIIDNFAGANTFNFIGMN